jgi:hypothetical protein
MLESQRSCLRRQLPSGWACEQGEGVAVKRGVDESGGGECFDGFATEVGGEGLPMSSVVAFQAGERSCRALLCRSLWSPDIVGQLPAMCPLLVNFPHMGQRRVGLCDRRWVL